MSDYYDRQGNPMTMEAWARSFEDMDTKRVERTETEQSEVSTVWMGLDHSFGGGPPLIFETLVFGGPLRDTMDRYSTEEQARAGHDQMVARVRDAERTLTAAVSLPEVRVAIATLMEATRPLTEFGDVSLQDALAMLVDAVTNTSPTTTTKENS